MGQQTIHLQCLMRTGEYFVVRLKYGFSMPRYTFQLFPLTLEFAVAHLERGLSPAETMMVHKGQMDVALNWQQQLNLNDGIPGTVEVPTSSVSYIASPGARGYETFEMLPQSPVPH